MVDTLAKFTDRSAQGMAEVQVLSVRYKISVRSRYGPGPSPTGSQLQNP